MDNSLAVNRKRFHILILEDNEPDLFMLKTSIAEAGVDCEITSFDDGVEALRYVKSTTSRVPDLMILDFNVPGVEGTTVLKAVRSSARWSEAGVFMFTASQDPAHLARVRKLGADECLRKPMDLAGFEKIGHTVRDWLEQSSARLGGERK